MRLLLAAVIAVALATGPAVAQEPEPEATPEAEPAPAPAEDPLDEPAEGGETAPEGEPEPEPEPEPAPTPEPAPDPSEGDAKAQAQAFVQEGKRLFGQELYAAAIEAFKKAYALDPEPAFLYNIAVCYERLGDAQNCVDWFEAYVDGFKKKNRKDPPDITDVRNAIAKCRLGARVDVYVETEPPGAAIAIDDPSKLLGQTPYGTQLDPGTYKFFIDLAEHQPLERSVEVRAGEPVKLFFKLEKVERSGTIRVLSNIRNAQIFIDGRNIGLTPYRDDIVVQEGQHQITVSKDEYISFSKEIHVAANEQFQVESELWLRDPPTTWKGPLGWTAASLGVVVGVGGFVAGLQADTFFSDTDDFQLWSTLQQVGYGVGGGLLAAGVTLIILEAVDTEMVKESDELGSAADADLPMLEWAPVVIVGPEGGAAGAVVSF